MPSTKKQTQEYINWTEKPINKNKKYKRGLSKKLRQKLTADLVEKLTQLKGEKDE